MKGNRIVSLLLCFFIVAFYGVFGDVKGILYGEMGRIDCKTLTFSATGFDRRDGFYHFVVDEDTQYVWLDKKLFRDGEIPEDNGWDRLGGYMQVIIVAGEETETGREGWESELCRIAKKIIVVKVEKDYFYQTAKPVIYLYPKEEQEVSVQLRYDGELTCTYPEYKNGWKVTASPDGTLKDEEGKDYNYLYWEGNTCVQYDFSEGFCVAGEDTAAFLEESLAKLGLTEREANEFIIYWLPKMQGNAYNLISFQTDAYTDHAELLIDPSPDTLIRVFMAWKPLEKVAEIPPQTLTAPERTGFTVVEWGGTEVGVGK